MSKIEDQIKQLQLRKLKIDYLAYIRDLLKSDKSCIDFLEVKDEVLKDILPKLDSLEKSIEENSAEAVVSSTLFSEEETKALKKLAGITLDRAKSPNQPAAPRNQASNNVYSNEQDLEATPQNPNRKRPQDMGPGDKMNFALANRHLGNKQVTGTTDKGVKISGKVVGLDAPYVHVETTEGPIVGIHIDNLGVA